MPMAGMVLVLCPPAEIDPRRLSRARRWCQAQPRSAVSIRGAWLALGRLLDLSPIPVAGGDDERPVNGQPGGKSVDGDKAGRIDAPGEHDAPVNVGGDGTTAVRKGLRT